MTFIYPSINYEVRGSLLLANHLIILVILKFSYLAALAVMSVCPVCKNNHQEEVSKCQRCNWSMQDDLNSIGINPEHPILKTCIPSLVKYLEAEITHKEKLQFIIQQLEIQESNSHKLDEILDEIEANKQKTYQGITTLKDQIIELKFLLESTNDNSDIEVKETNNFMISEHIQTSSPIENDDNIFPVESDRNQNNDFEQELNLQKGSFYDVSKSSENLNYQKDFDPEINPKGSYQSFYRLIKNGELEVTKVAVPQETMEKMRGGTQSELEFINDRKGNYWIVNWHDVYCLIPKEKIINQYQYGNFQRIFNCQNYKETYRDFEVIEPATVFKSNNETWQLERKGKINFI